MLFPVIVNGLVVPPVEDTVPNVCPPPANVFKKVADRLMVEDAPLKVRPVEVAKSIGVAVLESVNVLVPKVIERVFVLLLFIPPVLIL